MEQAREELETEALVKRYEEGNDPMQPVQEPVTEGDEVPTHVIPDTMKTPDQVIDEEKLAA